MAVSQDFGGLWVVHRRESWRTMSRYGSAISEVWVRPWPPLCTQHKWQTNRSQPSYGVCGWPLFQSKGEVTVCIFPAQCVAKILSKKGRNWTSMFKWQQTHDCVRTSCSKCTGSLTGSHQGIHDLRCPWDALHHYGPSLANDRMYFRWCDCNRNKWRQNVEKKYQNSVPCKSVFIEPLDVKQPSLTETEAANSSTQPVFWLNVVYSNSQGFDMSGSSLNCWLSHFFRITFPMDPHWRTHHKHRRQGVGVVSCGVSEVESVNSLARKGTFPEQKATVILKAV